MIFANNLVKTSVIRKLMEDILYISAYITSYEVLRENCFPYVMSELTVLK